MRLPTRVCDYFCVVDLDPELIAEKGLNATVTQKFPKEDHKDAEFPRQNDLPMFCHPNDLQTSDRARPPHHFSLVFTEANGARVYICILKYWVKLSHETVSKLKEAKVDLGNKIWFPTCLVLTSHWAFYAQHSAFLQKFHETVSSKTLRHIPIERLLCNYIYEIPLPPRGKIKVVATLFKHQFVFRRPEPNKAPLIPFSLERLFRQLSADNIALIITALLTEKRMLFVSHHVEYLNECIESLASLIYPFFWRHIYIPLLPRKLIDFICAPMPLMCGILKDYRPREELLEGVVVIDLDTNTIIEHPSDPIPPVPNKLRRYFQKRFSDSTQPLGDHDRKKNFANLEHGVREDVLKFTAKTMRGYQKHMNPQTDDVKAKFNKKNFIDGFVDDRAFYEEFVETQLFQCFVDDRFDADGGNTNEILYFDETISTYEQGSKPTPFLTDQTWAHKEIYKVPSANSEGLEDAPYSYGEYPIKLDHSFVGKIRTPTLLVSKEDLGHVRQKAAFDDIAIEFFSQKRLYDRVRNSLQARVRIQNKQFKTIHDYFRKSMSFQGTHLNNLEITKTDVIKVKETNSSYEAAIEQFRQFILKSYDIEKQEFDNSRDNLKSLYECITSTPHKCVAYFESFKDWERETSQRKVFVESAKNRCIKSTQQYEQRVRDYVTEKEHDILGKIPEERVDFISDALCRRDQHTFQYVEAATAFLYILARYKKRTPQLLTDVHEVSKQRLETFKSCMQRFVRDRRRKLNAQLEELEKLGQVVDAIDCTADLQEFLAKLKKDDDETKAPDWIETSKGSQVMGFFAQTIKAFGYDFQIVKEAMQAKFPEMTRLQVQEIWQMYTRDKDGERSISPKFPGAPKKKESTKPPRHDTKNGDVSPDLPAPPKKSGSPTPPAASSAEIVQTELAKAHFERSNSVENLRRLSHSSASPGMAPRHSTLSAVEEMSTSHLQIISEAIREQTYAHDTDVEDELEPAHSDPLDDNLNYYSINLWGKSGRVAITDQNAEGRDTLKDLTTLSENLVMIWQKKGDSLCKLSVPVKLPNTQTETRAWNALQQHSQNQGKYYAEMIETLKNIKRHLKISRKELRQSNLVMQQQIDIGEKNADVAARHYEQRRSEKNTLNRSYQEKKNAYDRLSEREVGWGRVRQQYVEYRDSQLKFQTAEARCGYSKHIMTAIRDTRDICTAVILDGYHDKEKKRQLSIQRVLASFVDSFFKMVSFMHIENDVLKRHFDQLNADDIYKEHSLSRYQKQVRSKANLDKIYTLDQKKMLSVRVDDGISKTEPYAKQSMDFLTTLYSFLDKRIETEKQEFNRLLQTPWNVRPSKPSLKDYPDTLSDALASLKSLMEHITLNISDWIQRTPRKSSNLLKVLYQEYENYLAEVRSVLRAKNMDFNAKGSSLLQVLKQLKEQRNRKLRLTSSLQSRRETDRPARFWQNSERQLEASLRDCENNIASLESDQIRLSKQLAKLNHDRLSLIDRNVKKFQQLEKKKIKEIKLAVTQFAQLHDTLILLRWNTRLKELQDYTLQIDPYENLKAFVRLKHDPQTIPKEVRKQLKAQYLAFIKAGLNSQMVVKEKLQECLKYPSGAFEADDEMKKKRSNTHHGGGKHSRHHSANRTRALRSNRYGRHASDDTILATLSSKISKTDSHETLQRPQSYNEKIERRVHRSYSGEAPVRDFTADEVAPVEIEIERPPPMASKDVKSSGPISDALLLEKAPPMNSNKSSGPVSDAMKDSRSEEPIDVPETDSVEVSRGEEDIIPEKDSSTEKEEEIEKEKEEVVEARDEVPNNVEVAKEEELEKEEEVEAADEIPVNDEDSSFAKISHAME